MPRPAPPLPAAEKKESPPPMPKTAHSKLAHDFDGSKLKYGHADKSFSQILENSDCLSAAQKPGTQSAQLMEAHGQSGHPYSEAEMETIVTSAAQNSNTCANFFEVILPHHWVKLNHLAGKDLSSLNGEYAMVSKTHQPSIMAGETYDVVIPTKFLHDSIDVEVAATDIKV